MSGLFQRMYLWRPPAFLMSFSPGATCRWNVLHISTCAPTSSTSLVSSVRIVARVATGTNAGVSISPCGVCITPSRARLLFDFFNILNENIAAAYSKFRLMPPKGTPGLAEGKVFAFLSYQIIFRLRDAEPRSQHSVLFFDAYIRMRSYLRHHVEAAR